MTPDQETVLLSTALAAIEKIVLHAPEAIEAVKGIIASVRNAQTGALDPATVIAEISELHESIAADNARTDAEAKAKFHPEG